MKKILLVDDHAPTRLLISKSLAQQDANYEFLEASNGREACETALAAKPDLILMDVLMPVMDGYEALASLKEDPETQAIRVLMLTALDSPLQQKLAYDLGAFGYVVKPVRLDEMNHTVKLALDRRRKSCQIPAARLPPSNPREMATCDSSMVITPRSVEAWDLTARELVAEKPGPG